MYRHLTYKKVHILIALLLTPIAVVLAINAPVTLAGIQVQNRFNQLSNSSSGAKSIYNIGFKYTNNSTPIGSVLIQFCDNGSLIGTPCTFPTGMNISSAVLSAQTGNTGYTISSLNSGQILLTRNPVAPSNSQSTYKFNNITNPTSPGEYWMRIQTFSSSDGSGPYVEQGGDAFSINSAFVITSIVPPYLTFCGGVTVTNLNCGSAAGDQISFGNFSDQSSSAATSQFVVATNAGFGYNVSIHGDTMTSGNFTIPAQTTPAPSRVGTSQFGINVVANSVPKTGQDPQGRGIGLPTSNYDTSNFYTYRDGDPIVSSSTASDFNEFTTTYLVNVSTNQAEGVYATTLNYICLANF